VSDRHGPPDGWWREFVLELPAKTAKLAIVSATGAPLVTPVWVALDVDELVFTTGGDTAKARAIRRDPRVGMCFDDQRPLFSTVTVYGRAALHDDRDEVRRWATEIAARYMGTDQADAYGERNSHPGELLVRVTPTKVIAAKDVAAWPED
jgi:PPOX class probable F420-dependent enzyme